MKIHTSYLTILTFSLIELKNKQQKKFISVTHVHYNFILLEMY